MKIAFHLVGTALLLLGLTLAAPSFAQTAAECNLSFDPTQICTDLPCEYTVEKPYCYEPPCAPGTVPITCPCACPPGQADCICPGSTFRGAPPYVCHPYPQPRPQTSRQCTIREADGYLTRVNTGEGKTPPSNPFDYRTFPGTNLLPNVYTDAFDGQGNAMPNTLPSTPKIPYNLHDGDPVVNEIDPRSPIDDLGSIFNSILEGQIAQVIELTETKDRARGGDWTDYDEGELSFKKKALRQDLRAALDIIEGEPVPYRAYSGFPLLHYTGPQKVKRVVPIHDQEGKLVGGNVDVHQIWYDQHIESDTAFIDPSSIMPMDADGNILVNVPWTVTYTVDVLNRGHDDFSPFVTYTDYLPNPDDPAQPFKNPKKPPNIGMDQSFFNMEDGTRTVFKIKMTYPKYLNLVYTWGWRFHPPRIQVMENATKKIGLKALQNGDGICPKSYAGCTLPQLEQAVFCNPNNPRLEPAPYSGPGATNTCNIPDLPNCHSVQCAPGQKRFDEEGNPTQCEQNKLYAIGRIGDFSPAKRMWLNLRQAMAEAERGAYNRAKQIIEGEVRPAFLAWQDRTVLPCFKRDGGGNCVDPCLQHDSRGRCLQGLEPEKGSDITILYVNNTIYGQLTQGGWVRWPEWESRYNEWRKEFDLFEAASPLWEEELEELVAEVPPGAPLTQEAPQRPRRPPGPPILHVTAYNADTFPHSYTIADFGGVRSWENQFKSSVKVAGSGCWFTFGRAYWWLPAGGGLNGLLCVPPAASADQGPGTHRFEVQFNFEASRRLRFYQFDPMHHDVAIYSIH